MIKHGTPPKNDPLLSKIEPMLAASANEPFDSPDFTYEPKWDGVRTIAFVDGGEVRLQTRNLLDCTKQYPEATQAAEALTGSYHAIVVGERLDSIYQPGARSPAWVKIKAFRTMECVIGGWTAGQGGRTKTLGALLLGVSRDGKLQPVGHVGTGFDERTLRDLLTILQEHESPTSPFATKPRTNQPARWCLPELVCEVEYAEITRDGTLRHPSYRGLRPDVDPRDATGEERSESAKKAQDAAKRAVAAPAPSEYGGQAARVPSVLEVEGKRIKLTNLEKVLFPEDGYTKADLIRYYTEVSPYLVPWLRDRPLTLKPFPDGIHGSHFYQKNKPGFTPEWIKSWTDPLEPENAYVLANDMATLVWMANYTAIEIHPRLVRIERLEQPGNVMIDLDAAQASTSDYVNEAAHTVKEVLDDLGLVGFPKTTGSRGIHVLVPIARRYSFEESRAFALRVGQLARERLPKLVTLEFSKSKRRGIYIDYLQNTRAKSTAGAYNRRPSRPAPGSPPLRQEAIP